MAPNQDLISTTYTRVNWDYQGPSLGLNNSFFLLGSCFAQEFAHALGSWGQQYELNPFGTLFNPLSMGKNMKTLLETKDPDFRPDLFEYQGLWGHPDFHTLVSKNSREQTVEALGKAVNRGRTALEQSSVVILTFGTAFCYEKKTTGRLWANCHGLPGDEFRRYPCSILEMTQVWIEILETLKGQGKTVFLTLSPVRHLRDDPSENSYSKALLRVFIQELLDLNLAFYFPAYEILLDELRDYRWYAEDLTHPGKPAAKYITHRFWEEVASPELRLMSKEYSKIQEALSHRPRNEGSSGDLQRQTKLAQQIENFQKLYPRVRHSMDS